MQHNGVRAGARRADRLASAVAWAAAVIVLVMVVCDQAFANMFCILSYLAVIVFGAAAVLHTAKFFAAAFQHVARQSYVSYGHVPISAALALLAVAYLPLKAVAALALPRRVDASPLYDPRMVHAQALLHLGALAIAAGVAADVAAGVGVCVLLPLTEVAAAAALGWVGWLYWRPVDGAPPAEDHSALAGADALEIEIA